MMLTPQHRRSSRLAAKAKVEAPKKADKQEVTQEYKSTTYLYNATKSSRPITTNSWTVGSLKSMRNFLISRAMSTTKNTTWRLAAIRRL